MGTLLPDDATGRDAVHVAVIVRTATGKLFPGQDVTQDGTREGRGEPVGIVDPFLKAPVQPGQRYWLFLYPRTITGLSHVWTHPAFDDVQPIAPAKAVSEEWLRAFTAHADCPSYLAVLASAEAFLDGWADSSEYLHFDGQDAHGEIPPEFWDHVSVVLGKPLPAGRKPSYFSCSC
jgi:hypothetical protein